MNQRDAAPARRALHLLWEHYGCTGVMLVLVDQSGDGHAFVRASDMVALQRMRAVAPEALENATPENLDVVK